jgi:ABC-type enterochelin transport system ATPase subunit
LPFIDKQDLGGSSNQKRGNIVQKILCQQAAAGMVLAKDVETPEGRILCGKGTLLTEAIIARFMKMDISYIAVEGHPVEVAGEKTLQEELVDIEKRFSRVKHVPPLMYLKKRIMARAVASRQEQES